MKFKLYAAPGCGSEIVELVLAYSKLPYEIETVDYHSLWTNEQYAKINPLKQVPALQLPNGEIMTESLAMSLYLNDIADLDLVPNAKDPKLAKFYHWAVYLVAAIYPTFTYADDTSRWVEGEESQKFLQNKIRESRKTLWQHLEKAIGDGPWFLGEQMSIVDFYLSVMSKWGPGKEWFEQNAPKIMAITKRMKARDELQEVYKKNG